MSFANKKTKFFLKNPKFARILNTPAQTTLVSTKTDCVIAILIVRTILTKTTVLLQV